MDRPHTHLPNQEEFSSFVNSKFDVCEADGRAVQFTLIECKSLLSNEHQECYSLVFRGPADGPADQNIYILENADVGTLKLFLVPIRKDNDNLYFEAIMNHLLSH